MKNSQTFGFSIFGFIFILIAGLEILAAGGDLDTTFTTGVAQFGSTANVVIVQTDGRILVGGSFTVVNGRAAPGIVRLNADGTTDQSFIVGAGINNFVNAIAVQSDGRVLVGGNFVNFGGSTRDYLVRLNADGSVDTTFNAVGAGPNNSVDVIALQPNGQILIGGFAVTGYNGTAIGRMTRLNTDGTLDTAFNTNLGAGFNGATRAITVEPDGQILVGGSFNDFDGITANRIARLNADGTPDTAFIANNGTGVSGGGFGILAIAVQTDGRILIGGQINAFNGTTRDSIARLNANGTLDTNWTVIQGDTVQDIEIQPDGQFFVACENCNGFGTGASQRRNIARLNASDGSIDLSFHAGTGADNATVLGSLALQSDGTLFVAGNFSSFNGITRSALVKLNPNGSIDLNFTTVIGAPSQVNELFVLPNDQILIGGDFRGVNELFRSNIARLNADGSVDATFNTGEGAGSFGSVFAIAVQTDGRILVGGSFTNFGGGANSDGIVRLNANGSIDASFSGRTNGTVNAIAVQSDGRIIVGGSFSNFNGVSGINRIVRLNADGSTDATFNIGTGFGSNVEDIVLQPNEQILVGGSFTSYNGINGVNRIARLNSDGTLDTTFTTNSGTGFDSQVNTLALQADGRILAGGFFGGFNGTDSERIVRLNSDGTRDTNFNVGTGFSNLVNDLTIQPDGRILAVGNFTTYNGVTRRHLARLNADGTLDASFRSGVEINNQLDAVGFQADGRIIIGGALRSYDSVPRFGIARVSAGDTLTWTGAADTNWNNGANWTGGNVPTSADNAVIPNNFTVNLSGGSFSVLTIIVGTNSTLSIAAGSSLSIEGGTNNGTIAGAGALNFIGTALGNNDTISVAAVNVQTGTSSSKALTGTGAFVGNTVNIDSSVTLALQNNHQFNAINVATNGIFDATSRTVSLRGANPLSGLGAISNAFGTIVLDGAAAQTVSRSVNFNNLTINNPAGVNFSAGNFSTIAGTLNLTNGILNLNTVTLLFTGTSTAVRTNGYITGVVRKQFSVAQPAFTYPIGTANGYSPVTINVTSGSPEITAGVTQTNQPSLNPAASLRRYWTLTSSGGAFAANLTFNYLQTDVFGNENNYRITRISGGIPHVLANNCAAGSPCVNAGANTAFISGVTALSDWTLSELAPTAANVSLGGRVTVKGRGVSKALVTLTGTNGVIRAALTNAFGYYSFRDVPAGQTYVLSARSKQFQLAGETQTFFAEEDRDDLDFSAFP